MTQFVVAFTWGSAFSVAALAIAVASIILAMRADIRAGRAEKRSSQAERRDEERLQREREEANAANRARLAIWPKGSTVSVDERRFAYVIRNHGKVTAYDVHVWLYDENGNDVSIKPQAGFALAPDGSADQYGVTTRLDVQPNDVRFGVNWHDGAGYHARLLNIPPAL